MDFLTSAFIFLAAGVIAVPIASKLGLGSVLGYLLAGTFIGPSVLGLVNETEDILHFAEFGVVMMLFLIGMEMQPRVLWRMRKPIIGLGGLQVALTTMAIAGIVMLLNFPWQTALAIGLVLALSSTAIALQILNEKHLTKTEVGKSSFSVLLFQDIAVIPIIAILPLLAIFPIFTSEDLDRQGHSMIAHLETWHQTLIICAVIGLIIFAGRYALRPIFRYIAESGLREIFTAAALLLVIGISLLMNLVGLSPALGAFVAGVVLADSEYSHEIEANIDPFKALLLGLFFISVGAGIDFGLIAEKPMLIIGITLGLVVLKFIILFVLSCVFKIIEADRYWFSFVLAQGGEFGFVLLSLSLSSQAIDRPIVEMLTVVIALSMILTPILILLNEKVIQPRFDKIDEDELDDVDQLTETQESKVILTGFGRFGQVVGRYLLANDVSVTVMDHNAKRIARVREFGFKLFYGDGSRLDLLRTAGAEDAKLLIIAIEDKNKTIEIIQLAQRHFPHLKILARAHDVMHMHELNNLNIEHIERVMFEGSMSMGKAALRALGMPNYLVERKAKLFTEHDVETILRLGQHREDRKRYVSETRLAEDEMIEILRSELPEQEVEQDPSIDSSITSGLEELEK